MVMTYIFDCVRIGTKPCKYFQLNSQYFDGGEGIFSKIETDKLIPMKWRLPQYYDDGFSIPEKFPVFIKPEWGQNAQGIYRVDDEVSLERTRKLIANARTKYLIQEGAPGQREFEIFFLRHHKNKNNFAVLSITEAINTKESNPVNSIFNPDTKYSDITNKFSDSQKQTLWQMIAQIERFGISRVSVRTDSTADLLCGRFHIIEINLFAPMPIHMLDAKYNKNDLWKMVTSYMMALARLTKSRDKSLSEKPVFTKIMLYDRRNTILNFIREKI